MVQVLQQYVSGTYSSNYDTRCESIIIRAKIMKQQTRRQGNRPDQPFTKARPPPAPYHPGLVLWAVWGVDRGPTTKAYVRTSVVSCEESGTAVLYRHIIRVHRFGSRRHRRDNVLIVLLLLYVGRTWVHDELKRHGQGSNFAQRFRGRSEGERRAAEQALQQ